MVEQPTNGTLAYRVDQLEERYDLVRAEFKEVNQKLDRLMVALLGGIFTLCVTLIAITLTLLTSGA